MIITLFLICIGMALIFGTLYGKLKKNILSTMTILFGIGGVISFIFVIVAASIVIEDKGLSKQILVYEQQNEQIETDITELINAYLNCEPDTLIDCQPNNAIMSITMYPGLKSDTLVEQQCNLYIENSREIARLKAKQASNSFWKWWLYFDKQWEA